MNDYPLVFVVIGVSGSGKTSIGRWLAQRLECDFLEGDRRHSPSNIVKMISQQPLQDKDRQPWLTAIEDDIRRAISQNRETVITCSALKAAYRRQLRSLGRVQLIWLNVPISVLQQRLADRIEKGEHYMKAEMLVSQTATFEAISPEEDVITVDGTLPANEVVDLLMAKLIQKFPALKKHWWERCVN